METIRPNAQRAKTAIVLIWIVFFAKLFSLGSELLQYQLLQAVAGGNNITEGAVASNDLRQRIIAIVYITVFIVSGVTFIQWFRRAYFNLHLRVSHLSESEGWAAGSWFVPFYNLYKPYHIMKELYEETGVLLKKNFEDQAPKTGTILLGWWWALWILNSLLGQVSFRLSKDADNIDKLISSTTMSIIHSVTVIILCIVTVKIIHDYAALEALLPEIKEKAIEEAEVDNSGLSIAPDL